jgi:Tfp pilus assembly protein PilV
MFCKNKKMFIKKLKGFLIAEVLVASFLLTAGLVSIMGVMNSSLRYSLGSQDTIIAVELAQEGVELVRNVRDNDLAAGRNGFTSFDASNKNCRISYSDTSVGCQSGQGSESRYTLKYIGNFYRHNDTSSERFSRYIYMKRTGGTSPNVLVRSFVYWGGGASGMFRAADTGSTGVTTSCTIAKKCVFTEIILTIWK